MSDAIRFDGDNIVFSGESGTALLMAFLLKAKYGTPLDPEVIFNEKISTIMAYIKNATRSHSNDPWRSNPFDRAYLADVADKIAKNAQHIGWWDKDDQGKREYLHNVVFSPYTVGDEDVAWILEATIDCVEWMRSTVNDFDLKNK
jgi:hypothetical protein